MSAARDTSAANGKHPVERTRARGIPLEKLGWTREMALEARQRVASLLDDWEDPSMDVYDEEPWTGRSVTRGFPPRTRRKSAAAPPWSSKTLR